MKRLSYISAALLTVTVFSIKIFNIDLSWSTKGRSTVSECESVSILNPGDPIPQIFKAKVPIRNYVPGETVGFEIMDMNWPHPFWFLAVVKNGYAYCDFGVGCPQDTGKIYKITGLRLPPNAVVPTTGELKAPLAAEQFFGPSYHKRL
jgi:hypothetical protein